MGDPIARARGLLKNVADAATEFGHACSATFRAHRLRIVAAGACVVLIVVGLVLILSGAPSHRVPPAPQAVATAPSATSAHSHPSSARASGQRSVAPSHAAAPSGTQLMHISIPSIGVAAGVIRLGINSDRTVQVPPLSDVGEAGWYKYSPLPGEVGPSIILGHINSARYGPGVFVNLANMHSGDVFTITRADHKRAVFRADRIAEYPKTSFPTNKIYGNTSGAKIRLITCGGKFDSSAGSYLDNIVVYGSLISLHPA